MALMPSAVYKPINYKGVPYMRSAGPNVIIFHTIVGHDPANAAHLSVGGYGELTQSRDTIYQSAACKDGNPRAIAVETEDLGEPFPVWNTDNGHEVPAWSEWQISRNIEICVWGFQTHGIPLVPATDSKTSSAGIAYHRQGIDGNFEEEEFAYGGRVSGGEHWSTSTGKVCPGDRRITQLLEIIIPKARQIVGLDPIPKKVFNMAYPYDLPAHFPDVPNTDPNYFTEVVVPLTPQHGFTGVTSVWVNIANKNAELKVGTAAWQCGSPDNHHAEPFLTGSFTIDPLGCTGGVRAPESAYSLIVDYRSPLGASVVIEPVN